MPDIVGVRFVQAGKIYYFDTAGIPLQVDDYVIVDTNRGMDMGRVAIPTDQLLNHTDIVEPLKPVIRKAEEEDFKQAEKRKDKNAKAMAKSLELTKKLELPMKLISAQYNLTGNHLVVFFTAEKRVDFRELVKELSRSLKTHVELRQIGARDEAKCIGGMGRCGLPLCCTTFLSEFSPVSIKMAKEQNITLNPLKTSGLCGRLLCCLGYECEQYQEMKKKLPPIGQEVTTSLGKAKVIATNPLKEAVTVELTGGATVEFALNQIQRKKESSH